MLGVKKMEIKTKSEINVENLDEKITISLILLQNNLKSDLT